MRTLYQPKTLLQTSLRPIQSENGHLFYLLFIFQVSDCFQLGLELALTKIKGPQRGKSVMQSSIMV